MGNNNSYSAEHERLFVDDQKQYEWERALHALQDGARDDLQHLMSYKTYSKVTPSHTLDAWRAEPFAITIHRLIRNLLLQVEIADSVGAFDQATDAQWSAIKLNDIKNLEQPTSQDWCAVTLVCHRFGVRK